MFTDIEGIPNFDIGPFRLYLGFDPLLGKSAVLGPMFFHQAVGRRRHHIGVEHEEVIDFIFVTCFTRLQKSWRGSRILGVQSFLQLRNRPDGPAGAHEAIARAQT
jgi:hypothetical protein